MEYSLQEIEDWESIIIFLKMEISYIYTQKRKEFGKQCFFADEGPHLIVDIEPNPTFQDEYFEVTALDRGTQCSSDMSLHEVNTISHPTESRGMNHMEGGWPADVDHKDVEQVARFKKKIEKDENYVNSVKQLSDFIEKYVMENNSIDIYEDYFAGECTTIDDESQFKILNVFRDYNTIPRSVLDLSWSLDGSKFAAAYAYKESQICPMDISLDSYVWDIENSSSPCCILKTEAPLNCIECSPKDLELLLGGYCNGQIGLWDIRTGGYPQQQTPVTLSHKEAVSDVKWLNTKSGTEFFTASTDGKLISWDARNLSMPLQTIYFDADKDDIPNLEKSYSITSLEYDPTLPHRFMLGTEQGTILSCNRKYKTPEEMVSAFYETRSGPLLHMERNAFFPKLFSSCDAWTVKIWSEDIIDSCVLNLRSNDGYITDAAWSPARASFLFVTKTTGSLELWDILIKHHEPVLSLKLESEALTCVRSKRYGDQIAVGTMTGCIHLLDVPQYYRSISKQEKNLFSMKIDREGKREKLLEGKTREQRIREIIEREQAEEEARLKELEIDKDWAPEDKADDVYSDTKEFESKFEMAEQDGEIGENEYLEKLSFDIKINEVLNRVLQEVTTEVESDNSNFPYIEYEVDDELEKRFLKDIECVASGGILTEE